MSSNLDLDVDDLKAYFEENKDHRVGVPGDEDWCPIAEYFYQKKHLSVSVGGTEGIVEDEHPSNARPLEKWESAFVSVIDMRYDDCDEVTGYQALAVLNEVIHDMNFVSQMKLWSEL